MWRECICVATLADLWINCSRTKINYYLYVTTLQYCFCHAHIMLSQIKHKPACRITSWCFERVPLPSLPRVQDAHKFLNTGTQESDKHNLSLHSLKHLMVLYVSVCCVTHKHTLKNGVTCGTSSCTHTISNLSQRILCKRTASLHYYTEPNSASHTQTHTHALARYQLWQMCLSQEKMNSE